MEVRTEERCEYPARIPTSEFSQTEEDLIIERARSILARRLQSNGQIFDSPNVVRDYLAVNYAALPHEIFGVIWINSQNRVIDADVMFRGTLTQSSVYPREVVKEALARNAAGAILFHNHPSGVGEPSTADEILTRVLKEALSLVDVRVFDHFIVAGVGKPTSFAERGLI